MLKFAKKLQENLRLEYTKELSFFKNFHKNKANWAIHAITIPMEWTASLLIISIFHMHWTVAAATATYHLILQSKNSIAAFLAQILFCCIAHSLHLRLGDLNSLLAAVSIHIFAWLTQVLIGHGILEGNAPAMATKLTINSVMLSVLLAWDSY